MPEARSAEPPADEEPKATEPGLEESESALPSQQEERREQSSDSREGRQQKPPAPLFRRFAPGGEEVRDVTPAERKPLNRRELLKLAPVVAVGAFAIPKLREPLLMNGLGFSDWASGELFGRRHLAQTFSDRDVVPFDRFPYNYYDVLDPEVDVDRWTLTVEGMVKRPGEYKLAQIRALPKLVQNTRHVCVEGWDVIGNFGGVRASDLLRWVGGDTSARFLEVECADEYYESFDMASILHPQTLFCYEMYGKPLDRGHGAPLRLQMPTKIGYKQAKYLLSVRVTNVLKADRRGYWEDQGYSWYGGL